MSLSLDLIGKFVLVTLMISVATGLILGFQTDISNSIGNLLGGDDSNSNAETVEIPNDSPAQDIAPLVDTCYNRYLQNSFEDYVCFIVASESGSISFSGESLENRLSKDVNNVTELSNNYDSSTIVIRYSSDMGRIVVE